MKRQLRASSQRLIKSTACVYDAARSRRGLDAGSVVILAYHRIGGGSSLELDIDTEMFADQMEWLAGNRKVVTLDTAVDHLTLDGSPDSNSLPVAITFDDGTSDFVDNAVDVLVANDLPATYYVATDFIESQRPFPDSGTPMSWAALADAASTGLVSIGSHTHNHAVMDKLDRATADDELSVSQELIADRLGVEARHFAYPKGVFGGEEVERLVAARYRSAALANCVVNRPGADPMRLERSPIQRSDGFGFFKRKSDGGMELEGRIRGAINRRRYGSLTN